QDLAPPGMAGGVCLPLGGTAAEGRPADGAASQTPAGPSRDLGAPRRAQSARIPPSLDVRHALPLESAVPPVGRSPFERWERRRAERAWCADDIVAAAGASGSRAAGNRDLGSRVRAPCSRVAARALALPARCIPPRRPMACRIGRTASPLGPGLEQHAYLARDRRDSRPALPVARRAAGPIAGLHRDRGLAPALRPASHGGSREPGSVSVAQRAQLRGRLVVHSHAIPPPETSGRDVPLPRVEAR